MSLLPSNSTCWPGDVSGDVDRSNHLRGICLPDGRSWCWGNPDGLAAGGVCVWKNCSKCWEIQPKVTQNKGNSWISIATSKRTWSWIWFPGWLHERFSFGVNTYFCTWRDGDSFVWIQSLLSSLLGLRRSPVKNGWRCIALFVHISD